MQLEFSLCFNLVNLVFVSIKISSHGIVGEKRCAVGVVNAVMHGIVRKQAAGVQLLM